MHTATTHREAEPSLHEYIDFHSFSYIPNYIKFLESEINACYNLSNFISVILILLGM